MYLFFGSNSIHSILCTVLPTSMYMHLCTLCNIQLSKLRFTHCTETRHIYTLILQLLEFPTGNSHTNKYVHVLHFLSYLSVHMSMFVCHKPQSEKSIFGPRKFVSKLHSQQLGWPQAGEYIPEYLKSTTPIFISDSA